MQVERHTGGSIPQTREPAYSLFRARTFSSPVLIAAPHGGRNYPPRLRARLRESDGAGDPLLRLEDRLIDVLALGVARRSGSACLIAHAPRALLDLNRAPDDVDWSMISDGHDADTARHASRRSNNGLGLIPRRLAGFGELWRGPFTIRELHDRIDGIHTPYHRVLGQTLSDIRDQWGIAVLIDLHSMPPLRTADGSGAEFVVGDRFGTSAHTDLSAAALDTLGAKGRRVAHNRPYAGGYVLDRHGDRRRSYHAIQIEVCRSLYLDVHMREQTARSQAVVKLLCDLTKRLADEAAMLANPGWRDKAAE